MSRDQQKQKGGRGGQQGGGGQKPGQRQQAEVDKKRKGWREIGQKQDEQDKKWRESIDAGCISIDASARNRYGPRINFRF